MLRTTDRDLGAGRIMTQASPTPLEELETTKEFVRSAYAAGVISRRVLEDLERYAKARYGSKVAAPHILAPSAPVPSREVGSRSPAPAGRPPLPPTQSRETVRPSPTMAPTSPAPQRTMAPSAVDEAGPSPWEKAVRGIRLAWSKLSADFAANSLIYLGVLVSVVVIFAFFAFGYFGEAVRTPSLRPPIFVAAPLLFFGLAWVLRNKTGVPAAANAVGLIGALILPIMLSALFRDGATWTNREGVGGWLPIAWIPDLAGPDRWIGYAVVGAVCALTYLLLARRHRIYAYAVAPMVWAAAGALGLYWAMDMSGLQMLTVLAAIAVGLLLASLGRSSRLGRTLSVPTVRVGVAGAPAVFLFALVFAYNDAVHRGVVTPGVADLASPGSAAAALLAMVLAIGSASGFAWEGLGRRTASALGVALRVSAYLAAGAAVVFALGHQATPGWIGAVLVGYGFGAALVDRRVGGAGAAVTWIARGSLIAGAALAIADPMATTVVWTGIALVAMARAVDTRWRDLSGLLVPYPESTVLRTGELWLPPIVVIGAGVCRIVDVADIPLVLMLAAGVALLARLLPARLAPLRSLAAGPVVVFGAASLVSGAVIQWSREPYSLTALGLGLAVLAAVAALTPFPWTQRLPAVLVTAVASLVFLMTGALGTGLAGTVMVVTVVLATTGVALVAASFVPRLGRWAIPHGLYGHLLLYVAIAASLPNEEAILVALAAAIAVHGFEAALVDRGAVPSIEGLVAAVPALGWVRRVPAEFTLVAATPLVIVVSRQLPWVAADPTRLAVPLSALAIGYGIVAVAARQRQSRDLAVALGYGVAAAAIAVAIPSGPMVSLAAASGAVATFVLALTLRVPNLSVPSWVLAFVAVGVAAAEAGVAAPEHLYRPVLAAAILVVLGSAAASAGLWQRPHLLAWARRATAVGSLAVATGMVGAVIDDQWLWGWAAAAAASMVAVVVADRAAPVIAAAWLYLFVAYADVFGDVIRSDAVWLLPFVVLLVAVSAILPGRRSWRVFQDTAPVTVLSALIVMAAAMLLAGEGGDPAATLAWSAAILGALAVIRGEEAWLHAGGLVLIGAGATAQGPWLTAALAVVAATETALAEFRKNAPGGRYYPWAAVTLWAATLAAAFVWLAPAATVAVVGSFGAGTVASAVALTGWLTRRDAGWTDRWARPLALLGQAGLVAAGVQASLLFSPADAALLWAAVGWVEASLVGVAGTVRRSGPAVWLSTVVIAVAFWLTLLGVQMSWSDVVPAAGLVGSLLLFMWLQFTVRPRSSAAALWAWPLGGLAQLALITSGVAASAGLDTTGAYRVWMMLTTVDLLAIGIAATLTAATWMAFVSAGLTPVVVGLGAGWLQLGDEEIVLWLSATIVAAVTASFITRIQPKLPRLATWTWPAHATTVVFGAISMARATALLDTLDVYLVGSVVAFLAGGYLLANRALIEQTDLNRALIEQTDLNTEWLSAGAFVASAALLAASFTPGEGEAVPVLIAIAVIGVAAAGLAGLSSAQRRTAWLIVALGFSPVASVCAMTLYGVASMEVGLLLLVNGAAFAAYAITARQVVALHLAIVTWLAGVLVLIEHRWALELHATVLSTSVVLLVMIEVERHRRAHQDLENPVWLRGAEWAAMVIPLSLAAREMVATSTAFGLLLGAEGALLLIWGMISHVRRRAIVGLAAITAAVLLAVMIPLIRGIGQGLDGEWWLVIGATVAVLFITAGSVIEKYRTRVGERLSRWEEVIELWE